uniref:Uncharacterized protein n=1 Tax=Arundo donax TaxID=35708 RepID=A0A0A9H4P8_ARUDO
MLDVPMLEDRAPLPQQPAASATCVVRRLGRYLPGLHRGTPKGWRQIGDFDGGRSFLQVQPLHPLGSPIHSVVRRSGIPRWHRSATWHPGFNCIRS